MSTRDGSLRNDGPVRERLSGHIRVPDYIALVRRGGPLEALALVHDKLPFAAFCGRACPHPCEQKCVRNEFGAPISSWRSSGTRRTSGTRRDPPVFRGWRRGPRAEGGGRRRRAAGLSAADTLARLGASSRCSIRTGNPAG